MTEHVVDDSMTRSFADEVVRRVGHGARFCGMFGSACEGGVRLTAVMADKEKLTTQRVLLRAGTHAFPSLARRIPSASWYERELRDLFGLEPVDHPRPDPLVFPFSDDAGRPRPGTGRVRAPVEPDRTPLDIHLRGEGVFTIPYGPVRSGVFESVEYLVETTGEDIPHLRTRVFYKHRGVEARFEGMTIDDGVLLAERCEGVASVAHAIAFCGAIERLAGTEVPLRAGLLRVLHAELERVANHLDSTIRHTEAAGQAVALARFTLHKERVQRLRAQLCGSRFGRGVVIPGGASGPPRLGSSALLDVLGSLESDLRSDMRLLLATPSFVDRLRGTGVIPADIASQYGSLGPVGRGSGQTNDVRVARPYDGYRRLGHQIFEEIDAGDALARQRVRVDEIWGSFHLIRQCVDGLEQVSEPERAKWSIPVEPISGEELGWSEAPQGEVLYLVELSEGRLVRVKPRSASFHNLALFPLAFPKDVLTDVAFIEASFGLSIAGVAG
ncbi:MAG: hydrogenase large subunit [Acidimicrobiales bacterium]